ncbi:HNH endonuclease family protein [Bradyrhizobium sp. P5_C11_2]
MATSIVNLDALIRRDDFRVKSGSADYSRRDKIAITDIEPKAFMYLALRKPDFQRETANWSPQKIQDFVKTFLEGDLVPAIILWAAGETVFVIDGAHRLSALIAWVQNDYGDGDTSRVFSKNDIPPEQMKAARKTRELIDGTIGSYSEHVYAVEHPDRAKVEVLQRARRLASLSLDLQWIRNTDSQKAENSFFKINQAATAIDPTELRIIRARKAANAISARVITRNSTGHEYWSEFEDDKRDEIESIGRELYKLLFHPPIETPIKTLDLPVAGRGYSSPTLPLIFEMINLANNQPVLDMTKSKNILDLPPPPDGDGSDTIKFLRNTRKIINRITGLHASSLGLHPAVYFYSATGRHQPTAFLAVVELVREFEKKDAFQTFTKVRERFEQFILDNKSFSNQVTVKIGSGAKGFQRLKNLYVRVYEGLVQGNEFPAILEQLRGDKEFSFLTPDERLVEGASSQFSRETKSATFLRDAIVGAPRCRICNALLHFNSIQIDHVVRKADGGLGVLENAQLAHPFCNSSVKN